MLCLHPPLMNLGRGAVVRSYYPAPQVASKGSKPSQFVQKQNKPWPLLHPLLPVPPAQVMLCQRDKAGGEVRNISSSKDISKNISRGQAPAPGLSEFVLSWGNFSAPTTSPGDGTDGLEARDGNQKMRLWYSPGGWGTLFLLFLPPLPKMQGCCISQGSSDNQS